MSDNYAKMLEEAATASCIAYDCQWSPDFTDETDHPIAILQLAFPITGNTYVLQLPLLDEGIPDLVRKLFENPAINVAGFCANEMTCTSLRSQVSKLTGQPFRCAAMERSR